MLRQSATTSRPSSAPASRCSRRSRRYDALQGEGIAHPRHRPVLGAADRRRRRSSPRRARPTGASITVEDHYAAGGIGDAVARGGRAGRAHGPPPRRPRDSAQRQARRAASIATAFRPGTSSTPSATAVAEASLMRERRDRSRRRRHWCARSSSSLAHVRSRRWHCRPSATAAATRRAGSGLGARRQARSPSRISIASGRWRRTAGRQGAARRPTPASWSASRRGRPTARASPSPPIAATGFDIFVVARVNERRLPSPVTAHARRRALAVVDARRPPRVRASRRAAGGPCADPSLQWDLLRGRRRWPGPTTGRRRCRSPTPPTAKPIRACRPTARSVAFVSERDSEDDRRPVVDAGAGRGVTKPMPLGAPSAPSR